MTNKKTKNEEQLALPLRQQRRRVQTKLDPTRITEQHHRDGCNINMIVARAQRTGMLPQQNVPAPFMDAPALTYHEALELVRSADSSFHSLPAPVRAAYKNDPGLMLQALEQAKLDPKVQATLVEQGLLSPKVSQKSTESPPAPKQKGSKGEVQEEPKSRENAPSGADE